MKTKYWVILVRRPPATWEALPGEWGSKAQAERYAMDKLKGQWAVVPVVTAKEEADGTFRVPAGLVREGQVAAEIIRDFCREHSLSSGEQVFHHPAEWNGRFGRNSLLIVLHEGTDADRALSMDGAFERNGGDYSLYDALTKRLQGADVFIEQCTRSYSAVYHI